jgi:hypothetical protein
MVAMLQERNGGRARKSEEKIRQHGVAMKLDVKMRRGGLLLRERGRGDPPCMLSKCHSKRRKLTHGEGEAEGHTMREGNSH